MTQYLSTIFPSRYGSEGEKASKKKEMAEEKGKRKQRENTSRKRDNLATAPTTGIIDDQGLRR